MSWLGENRLPLLVALFLVAMIIAVGAANRLTGTIPLGPVAVDNVAAPAA
jgi:hypothetical protein